MYAPGTSKTDRAGNGSQLFSWGRAAADRHAAARRFFPRAGFPVRCSRERRRASTDDDHRRRHASSTSARISRGQIELHKGVVDLADELHGEEREPLRNRDRFSEFYLDYGLASIAWLDGQDFTPEFLYDKLKAMN